MKPVSPAPAHPVMGAVLSGPPIDQLIREQMGAAVSTKPVPPPLPSLEKAHYAPADVIRVPCADDVGGFRVWVIAGVHLGELGQEGHYRLRPLDRKLGNGKDASAVESLVPCWMMDTHPGVEML